MTPDITLTKKNVAIDTVYKLYKDRKLFPTPIFNADA